MALVGSPWRHCRWTWVSWASASAARCCSRVAAGHRGTPSRWGHGILGIFPRLPRDFHQLSQGFSLIFHLVSEKAAWIFRTSSSARPRSPPCCWTRASPRAPRCARRRRRRRPCRPWRPWWVSGRRMAPVFDGKFLMETVMTYGWRMVKTWWKMMKHGEEREWKRGEGMMDIIVGKAWENGWTLSDIEYIYIHPWLVLAFECYNSVLDDKVMNTSATRMWFTRILWGVGYVSLHQGSRFVESVHGLKAQVV